jgi:RNA polymerase sigma-70 factor (ECF subfamily)
MPGQHHGGKPPSSVSEIAALAKVFEAHRPRLMAMVQRRIAPALAPRTDPEDILGEAFLRASLRWSHHEPAMSTFAWLYRITLDCLIDAWRSANTDGRSLQKEVPWPERSSAEVGMGLIGSVTSPSVAIARNEQRERIHWVVEQLKPEDREILGMRHFDDLSYVEIATVLEINADAAMQRYSRALRRFKKLWKEIEPGDEP